MPCSRPPFLTTVSARQTGLSQTAFDGSKRSRYADYKWTYDADGEVLGFVNEPANVGGADCYAAEGISGFSYDSQGL